MFPTILLPGSSHESSKFTETTRKEACEQDMTGRANKSHQKGKRCQDQGGEKPEDAETVDPGHITHMCVHTSPQPGKGVNCSKMPPLSAKDPGDSNCLEDEEPKGHEVTTGIYVEKCQHMNASLREKTVKTASQKSSP